MDSGDTPLPLLMDQSIEQLPNLTVYISGRTPGRAPEDHRYVVGGRFLPHTTSSNGAGAGGGTGQAVSRKPIIFRLKYKIFFLIFFNYLIF